MTKADVGSDERGESRKKKKKIDSIGGRKKAIDVRVRCCEERRCCCNEFYSNAHEFVAMRSVTSNEETKVKKSR